MIHYFNLFQRLFNVKNSGDILITHTMAQSTNIHVCQRYKPFHSNQEEKSLLLMYSSVSGVNLMTAKDLFSLSTTSLVGWKVCLYAVL